MIYDIKSLLVLGGEGVVSLLMKYFAISHSDSCNKYYIYIVEHNGTVIGLEYKLIKANEFGKVLHDCIFLPTVYFKVFHTWQQALGPVQYIINIYNLLK